MKGQVLINNTRIYQSNLVIAPSLVRHLFTMLRIGHHTAIHQQLIRIMPSYYQLNQPHFTSRTKSSAVSHFLYDHLSLTTSLNRLFASGLIQQHTGYMPTSMYRSKHLHNVCVCMSAILCVQYSLYHVTKCIAIFKAIMSQILEYN